MPKSFDWDTKLKRFLGRSKRETIELLRHEHTWVGIGRLLGVQGQTVSKYYNRLITPKAESAEIHHVRNRQRINYLKELKKFMATAKGEKVKEYNLALQLRREEHLC